MSRAPYSRLDFYSDHPDQRLTCAQGGREPSVVETSENDSHQSLFDQSFQSQEMAFSDPLGYQTEITGFHSQAVHSPSLVALLDSQKPEHKASHSSNSRLCQDSPQSSQNIYQDMSCASSSVFGLAHDKSGVLPLHDQYGGYHQANVVLSALTPHVYTGNPEELKFSEHSTSGLEFPTTRNYRRRSRFKSMGSRISSRFWALYPR